MKKQGIILLSVMLVIAMLASFTGCDFLVPITPPEDKYSLCYDAKTDISTDYEYGNAEYGQEITLTLSFYEQENVLVTVYETEFYDVIGDAEFNTNNYNRVESTGLREDISFKIRIDKESDGLQTVKVRLSCLCGEEDCGRFAKVSDAHYYDVQAFFFIADSQGIMFSKDTSTVYEDEIHHLHDSLIAANERRKNKD